MMNFDGIKYFKRSEFDSPDLPGSGVNMQLQLVSDLDLLRGELGFPLVINSGYRTKDHNQKIGGEPNSAHLRGWAADIQAGSKVVRFEIINKAIRIGFRRIGIAETFIHLDQDPTLPDSVIWIYGPATRSNPGGIL